MMTIPAVELNNGTTIPQLGFGTLAVQANREENPLNTNAAAAIVAQALEVGFRHIDTAQAYGSEPGVGKAVAESGLNRDEVYLTSKLSNGNHKPPDVRRSLEKTLANLGIEQIDLFLIHWPLPTVAELDYVDTWREVTGMMKEGKVRTAGVSNFEPAHIERLIAETGVVPAVNQIELHPYFTNDAVHETCKRYGIAVEAHSPLGHRGAPLQDQTIRQIAETHGKSPAQIILRWHMQCGIIAIPKSANIDRMRQNLAIFDFELSHEEVAAISALDKGEAGRVGPNPNVYEGV